MKKITSIILILFWSNLIFGQFAIIKDDDGFTNVRKLPDSKSEIIYKLIDSEVFFFSEVKYDSEWVAIQIPKNKFYLSSDYNDETLDGYIHKSRLLESGNLKEFNGANFSIKYDIQDFKPETKIIDYSDGIITKINGRQYYGSDGSQPKNEIADIKVSLNDLKIQIAPIFYQDIFEVNNRFTVYKNKDDFIVSQWNSDGAGGYLLIWVFGEKSIKQRLIFIP